LTLNLKSSFIGAKRGGRSNYDFIRFGRSSTDFPAKTMDDKKASNTYDYIRFGRK